MMWILVFFAGALVGGGAIVMHRYLVDKACEDARAAAAHEFKTHHNECLRAYRRGRDWKRF